MLGGLLNLLLQFRGWRVAPQLLKLLLDSLELLWKRGLGECASRCDEHGGCRCEYEFPQGVPPAAHVITMNAAGRSGRDRRAAIATQSDFMLPQKGVK